MSFFLKKNIILKHGFKLSCKLQLYVANLLLGGKNKKTKTKKGTTIAAQPSVIDRLSHNSRTLNELTGPK